MKIAVTYDNGNVFQHFGRTEAFKVYEVEDNKVVSSEVIGSNGIGHGALAGLLATQDIQVLICGGMGEGARMALRDEGIEVCAGAEGNTDEVVEAYLRGELSDAGATCDHHHGEGEGCGDHEEDCHSGGCHSGGCHSGGCHEHTPLGKNDGKSVKVHYRGTFDDGTEFDSSYNRGETLNFVCGAGQMIPGFDKAVAGMDVGQIIKVHLMPEEAYGPYNPQAVVPVPIKQMPGAEDLEVGAHVYLMNPMGQQFPVFVKDKTEDMIFFDTNHEMAGKELNFEIELVEIL